MVAGVEAGARGGGTPRRRGPAGPARPPALPGGRGRMGARPGTNPEPVPRVSPAGRAPDRAGPATHPPLRPSPPRPAEPPQGREGGAGGGGSAARGGRGGVRDAGGGSQGSRRLGSQHPAGAEGRTRPVTRSREGLAGSLSWGRLVREEGRGGRGRSFSLPSLYFLQQDVGRPLTSWGLPAPPLARAEWGRGRLRGGGDPKGVSSATRRRKGKVIVKLETH